jgi:hypothetical protein
MPTPPVLKYNQFDVDDINPSGSRHLQTASGWIKELGVGAGEYLDFGSKNITAGKQTSDSKAIVGFVSAFNDANEAVFNLRFYVTSFSAFDGGSFFFNGFPSGEWIQGIQLNDASGKFIPAALPSGQNWWRQAGGAFNRNDVAFQELTGVNSDDQVTQFMYLSITADTDVPPKTYGGDAGGYTYRTTFDYR